MVNHQPSFVARRAAQQGWQNQQPSAPSTSSSQNPGLSYAAKLVLEIGVPIVALIIGIGIIWAACWPHSQRPPSSASAPGPTGVPTPMLTPGSTPQDIPLTDRSPVEAQGSSEGTVEHPRDGHTPVSNTMSTEQTLEVKPDVENPADIAQPSSSDESRARLEESMHASLTTHANRILGRGPDEESMHPSHHG